MLNVIISASSSIIENVVISGAPKEGTSDHKISKNDQQVKIQVTNYDDEKHASKIQNLKECVIAENSNNNNITNQDPDNNSLDSGSDVPGSQKSGLVRVKLGFEIFSGSGRVCHKI